MDQPTILLVEDDSETRQSLQAALSAKGYRVVATDLARSAWHLFAAEKPGLAVLDITLPDGTGLELCRKIRGHAELGRIPVIILTAKSDFDDKTSGFEAGADQYLVKPLAPRDLVLWVEALLRRLTLDAGEGDALRAGDCELDLKSRLVRFKDRLISELTVKEFDLLYFLVKKRPQIVSRKQVLTTLWRTVAVDHVVDTHLYRLRKKLPQELADKIQAVPGKGYRFVE